MAPESSLSYKGGQVWNMSKILVIDDSIFARNMIRKILVNKGYDICGEASNGKEGFEAFKSLKPDLVLCDLMMDEMDGLECLRAMLAENPAANVVICTSATDELHAHDAIENGAKGFLKKPINATELISITRKLIGEPAADKKKAGRKKSCKTILEERASERGIAAKQLLDFYAAFHQFTGLTFDDKKVDVKFLQEKGPGIRIGVCALLAAKMPSDQAEEVMNVFESLYL